MINVKLVSKIKALYRSARPFSCLYLYLYRMYVCVRVPRIAPEGCYDTSASDRLLILFQGNYRWRHATNRTVSLESTHILLLHEFERVALKKVALGKLNSSDLGFTARIPKGNEGRR